jgi:hypothetical protein
MTSFDESMSMIMVPEREKLLACRRSRSSLVLLDAACGDPVRRWAATGQECARRGIAVPWILVVSGLESRFLQLFGDDMKKMMLLASLAVTSVSIGAMALTVGLPRAVAVAGSPAGVASFFFNGNGGGPLGACSYFMDWQGPLPAAGSAGCDMIEDKALGQAACLGNRLFDVPTHLTSRRDCQGFDEYGLIEDVSLVLGESVVGAPISGVAVFSQFPFIPRSIVIS